MKGVNYVKFSWNDITMVHLYVNSIAQSAKRNFLKPSKPFPGSRE